MKTSDFDYYLPPELIAQTPIEPRDQSRLMVLNRSDKSITHHRFDELVNFLQAGDVIVFNNSRVIPARLSGKKADSGGVLEILLLRRVSPNVWETLVRPGKLVKIGGKFELSNNFNHASEPNPSVLAEVVDEKDSGIKVIRFSDESSLPDIGRIALPPYIHTPLTVPERYQTVYASASGSVAAPTAGLHFSPEVLQKIKAKGVHCLFVTLHIGLDTFLPVRKENPLEHPIHSEYGILSPEVANQLAQARADGRRIICVGTTTVRLVEAVAQASHPSQIKPLEGWVNLFILPGHCFQMVDAMLTNFHLPKSTLLMLVSAFAGKDLIDKAYREAIDQKYRFYSFGDCVLIL